MTDGSGTGTGGLPGGFVGSSQSPSLSSSGQGGGLATTPGPAMIGVGSNVVLPGGKITGRGVG